MRTNHGGMRGGRLAGCVALCATLAGATTYFVDYEGGGDERAGTTPETAFRHCPGSDGATGAAAALRLVPGDRVVFKGGVRYRQTVTVAASGTAAQPIVFDGNAEGRFGMGSALIDGGEEIGGWRPCASQEEAGGNPHWRALHWTLVPRAKGQTWRNLNLCAADVPLPVAQDPNPTDPLFQEVPSDYHRVEGQLRTLCPAKVYPEKGTRNHRERPLLQMFVASEDAAVVEPIPAAFTAELPQPAAVVAFGIFPQPGYAPLLGVAVDADGKEILSVRLPKEQKGMQRFELPRPATFTKLTVRLLSLHPGASGTWTAVRKVAAFDAEGRDVLAFPVSSALVDARTLTASDPAQFADTTLGVYAGRAAILYMPIRGYSPAEHRLDLDYYGGRQYADTRYAFFNGVRLIDRPGEWSATPTADDASWRIVCWLPEAPAGTPITMSRRAVGIRIEKASHVVVQGFRILRQGGDRSAAGIAGRGAASHVEIRDCEVTLVNGVGITTTQIDDVVVERCRVHENPGHTKGIVLRNASRQTVQDCDLMRNTSTGIDFYTCAASTLRGNSVRDHKGMHANGITAYLGCTDLLVENNRVLGGNTAFTCQDAERILVRNNVFSGAGKSCAIGFWTGPIKDARVLNNTLVGGPRNVDWSAGFFTNCRKGEGWVFRNNIIDGLAGDIPGDTQFSHNLYTFRGPWQLATADRPERPLADGERFAADPGAVFADAAADDFRPQPGGPAIDTGTPLGDAVPTDIEGTPRPQGAGWDIGAYESR